jgi:hypothetical protein
MRTWVLATLMLLGGCTDDDDGGAGGKLDMQAPLDGGGGAVDLAMGPEDMSCIFRSFGGFIGTNDTFHSFDCSCGCSIDRFDNVLLSGIWGASTLGNASFQPMANVGLGVSLTASDTSTAQGGLVSVSTIARFYLAGDFDVLVDYDFGPAPPPGEAHLVLGVREISGPSNVSTFEVARVHLADGTDDYQTHLGGIDAHVPTTATHGTLRMTRQGLTLTGYGDGSKVSTRITSNNPRLALTMAATLQNCADTDGGAGSSCNFTPRWHLVRMNTGVLVNQP